jgi:hypothetical protein
MASVVIVSGIALALDANKNKHRQTVLFEIFGVLQARVLKG